MKTRILLLAMLLKVSLAFADDYDKATYLFYQPEDTIKAAFQSMLDESGKTFTFMNVRKGNERAQFTYIDEATRNEPRPHIVLFYCRLIMVGENKDLEIEGTPVYSLSIAEGKFLDFARWWIKYIRPGETLETLSAKGKDKISVMTEKTGEDLQFLKQNDGKWILRGY